MKRILKWGAALLAGLAIFVAFGGLALAQDGDSAAAAEAVRGVDTVWLLVAAMLVFFMQAGFALLESGATRSKNTINILVKNLVDFAFATITFWAVGYAFMFGEGTPWIGLHNFFLAPGWPDVGNVPVMAFWFFQLVFAGTAATIVSGAVAERTKFSAYVIFSIIITAIIYPIFGHWTWGGGWLNDLGFLGTNADGDPYGFLDFAGSTIVHSVGGWAGLMGAIILGPRIGRYNKKGESTPIPGHSLPLMALGVFILWLGWFGFNPGSELAAVGGSADAIALIAANTNLAAAAGALAALVYAWIRTGKPDAAMAFNGVLGGLVAITAPCAFVDPFAAVIIGAIGGVIVPVGITLLDRAKIDDPVGAVPVHLMAGAWGTLAVGLFPFNISQLLAQLIGIVACAIWVSGSSYLLFTILHRTMGLRVSPQEEEHGLDWIEHGSVAYPEAAAAAAAVREVSGSFRAGTFPSAMAAAPAESGPSSDVSGSPAS